MSVLRPFYGNCHFRSRPQHNRGNEREMSTTTATSSSSLSTAERARKKAEARRSRILAKSADRLDVVCGLTPTAGVASRGVKKDDDDRRDDAVELPRTPRDEVEFDEPSSVVVVPPVAVVAAVEECGAAEAVDTSADDGGGGRGARRMAAMRRRRYLSKGNVGKPGGDDQDEATGGKTAVVSPEPALVSEEVDAPIVAALPVASKEEEDGVAERGGSENDSAPTTTTTTVDASTSVVKKSINKEEEEEVEQQKKYMGVARMRRKLLKDQKEKRLQEIASDGRAASAAEMATMGVTASMVRKGVVVEVDGIGVTTTKGGMMSRKAWYAFIVPPMKVVPRLVTLLLLFFAGLDLGTQPHRGGRVVVGDAIIPSDGAGSGNAFGGGLIRHVKPSLTRPWECGVGGKIAYMTGMMPPPSPPTALPTSYQGDPAATRECDAGGGEYGVTTTGGEACAPPPPSVRSSDETKDEGKVEKRSIFAMDDEFDLYRTTRPKGVDREFDDDDDDYHGAVPPGVVDPVFRVDLDSLLRNANLPGPIDYAAKFAINFHRMWVRYLWTIPTSFLRYLFALPMKALGGWLANPPWMLGVALLVRFVTQVLVGNGKSPFSLDSKKDDSESGGKGGSGGLDVLGKAVDFAKNYAASTFPRTSLVLGTLMKVMKVDMYVLLCGMLIGLVITPVEDDGSTGIVGSIIESEGRVLGDGEL
jgi:hypothetical protein